MQHCSHIWVMVSLNQFHFLSRYSYHINLQNETFAKLQYRPRYFQNIKNFVIYDRIEIFDPEQVHDFLE